MATEPIERPSQQTLPHDAGGASQSRGSITLPSLGTSLGQLFQDLSMVTPGPTRTEFQIPNDSNENHGQGLSGQNAANSSSSSNSNSTEEVTLPDTYTSEPLEENLFAGYQNGPQLPRLKDILPIVNHTSNSEEANNDEDHDLTHSFKSERAAHSSRACYGHAPNRLNTRGHCDVFTSFGQRASVDMPSASLEHFSVTKKRRNGDGNETHARRRAWIKDENVPSDIISKFVRHPELAINLARFLPVQDLIGLYAISKDFHYIVNHRFTTVIMSQANRRAPESAKMFPFRCYASLCQEDPAERPHPVESKAAAGLSRTVPTFRWLKMVCFREMVVHQIVVIMAEDGVPVPKECVPAIKKMWLMMDMPDNIRRIGFIQNEKVFTDQDLFFLTMFFIKLDMRFTDPLTGSGSEGMRNMLLSQPSLSYLWRALKRTILISKLEALRMFIRWKQRPNDAEPGQSLFGVPAEEIGMTQYEAWGKSKSRKLLLRPDELVMREAIRRGLKLQKKYTDMMLWGYVNMKTLENIKPQRLERTLPRLEGLEQELTPFEDRWKIVPSKKVSYRVIQGG